MYALVYPRINHAICCSSVCAPKNQKRKRNKRETKCTHKTLKKERNKKKKKKICLKGDVHTKYRHKHK